MPATSSRRSSAVMLIGSRIVSTERLGKVNAGAVDNRSAAKGSLYCGRADARSIVDRAGATAAPP